MNWYALKESSFVVLIFAFLLYGGLTLKGKNLLPGEQILSFKSRPLLEGNRKPKKNVSFYKNGKRTWRCTHSP